MDQSSKATLSDNQMECDVLMQVGREETRSQYIFILQLWQDDLVMRHVTRFNSGENLNFPTSLRRVQDCPIKYNTNTELKIF